MAIGPPYQQTKCTDERREYLREGVGVLSDMQNYVWVDAPVNNTEHQMACCKHRQSTGENDGLEWCIGTEHGTCHGVVHSSKYQYKTINPVQCEMCPTINGVKPSYCEWQDVAIGQPQDKYYNHCGETNRPVRCYYWLDYLITNDFDKSNKTIESYNAISYPKDDPSKLVNKLNQLIKSHCGSLSNLESLVNDSMCTQVFNSKLNLDDSDIPKWFIDGCNKIYQNDKPDKQNVSGYHHPKYGVLCRSYYNSKNIDKSSIRDTICDTQDAIDKVGRGHTVFPECNCYLYDHLPTHKDIVVIDKFNKIVNQENPRCWLTYCQTDGEDNYWNQWDTDPNCKDLTVCITDDTIDKSTITAGGGVNISSTCNISNRHSSDQSKPDPSNPDPANPDPAKPDKTNTIIYISIAIVVVIIILGVLFFLFKSGSDDGYDESYGDYGYDVNYGNYVN
jgi:hypothetical protein